MILKKNQKKNRKMFIVADLVSLIISMSHLIPIGEIFFGQPMGLPEILPVRIPYFTLLLIPRVPLSLILTIDAKWADRVINDFLFTLVAGWA